ncbi:ParB/RepB/Spo0J family partition protein [Pandoraea cepalis]|nr:ParB/RepB/Spo0J family partition protein [Pandoraea cepalis]
MSLRNVARPLSSYQEVMDGEIIVDLDPAVCHVMPQQRNERDAAADELFYARLKEEGQNQPGFVRPDSDRPGHFIVIFGHRRRDGAEYNGTKFRAVVRKVDEDTAWKMQWSENVDRENLSPLDIGRAIQDREAKLGSLTAVAKDTGRSLNWLSKYKRFAEAFDAGGPVKTLIQSHATTDVATVSEIFSLQSEGEAGYTAAEQLVVELQQDPTLRLRDRTREMKGEVKETGQAPKPRVKEPKSAPAEPNDAGQVKQSPAGKETVNGLLMQVYMELIEKKSGTVRKALNSIGDDGREKIERALKKQYNKGHTTTDHDYSSVVVANLLDGNFGQDGAGLFNMVAFMEGKIGAPDGFVLNDILAKAKTSPAQ